MKTVILELVAILSFYAHHLPRAYDAHYSVLAIISAREANPFSVAAAEIN
jgi:hypothetical protein